MHVSTNYFVCSLGEAAGLKDSELPFSTVNDLLQRRAAETPDSTAIGFFQPSNDSALRHGIFTFAQILHSVKVVADRLAQTLHLQNGQKVALLSSSSPEFLFVWLACVWLGCPVLLIAPECSPSGVAALSSSCSITILLSDEKHSKLASEGVATALEQHRKDIAVALIESVLADNAVWTLHQEPMTKDHANVVQSTDIAYLHHSSGTSSGTPKPIAQSHHGAVGALPHFKSDQVATFTTTPLYHGGPADIFRAWTSGAMIWLFPSNHLPVTANNVIRCLECARRTTTAGHTMPIKYFTSVPYILQIMAESEQGLRWLQEMDLVGVGGAALAQDVGNNLVRKSVHLVSRYGSAECGFLMSSHRDYEHDKDWQFLRMPQHHPHLSLEARPDGLSELVVLAGWPHMAKTNRADASYATADLFEPHPSIANAWRYHSRADSQLTLVTGKKFDPAPIEDAISAASSLISTCLVFGEGRPYPGALIFRSKESQSMDDSEVIAAAMSIVEKINHESQAHVELSQTMLIAMPYTANPLEKTSKGTVLRGRAAEKYSEAIANAYCGPQDVNPGDVSNDELPTFIKSIITKAASNGDNLEDTTNLFSFGIDSIAGMRIRQILQNLLPADAPRLPINVVEDCGTVQQLAKYISAVRGGGNGGVVMSKDETRDEMIEIAKQYAQFQTSDRLSGEQDQALRGTQKVVIVTGVTGSLGAHVLDQLLTSNLVVKVICLVRAQDTHSAATRVEEALRQRKLSSMDREKRTVPVTVIPAKLGAAKLGLDDTTYAKLAQETTTILHLAWSVNFRMSLRSFVQDNIAGMRNLVDLSLASTSAGPPRIIFCSSTASALACAGNVVPETIVQSPDAATETGYSRSKWVAEQICDAANKLPQLQGRLTVLRVGQLSGDTQHGIWNVKEAWPMMLSTVKLVKCLPKLSGEVLDWLPVDLAAAAIIESIKFDDEKTDDNDATRVFHVLNDHERPTWVAMLHWLQRYADFEVVQPSVWMQKLESVHAGGNEHPALQLLDHWKQTLQDSPGGTPTDTLRKRFAMTESRAALPSLRNLPELDEPYFAKLWSWIDANVN